MEVDEKVLITPTSEGDTSEVKAQETPVTVTQVGLPLCLQFLRQGNVFCLFEYYAVVYRERAQHSFSTHFFLLTQPFMVHK